MRLAHTALESNGRPPGNGRGPLGPAPGDGPEAGTAWLGMAIFLLSLGVLFLGSLVAYAVTRWRTGTPPTPTPLPDELALSTALILAGSATVQGAAAAARANRQLALRLALVATLGLGLAFLASQAAAWLHLVAARTTMHSSLWGWSFYFLTGLHAAHVIGGLVPLGIVTVNAFYGRYSPLRHSSPRFVAMYWHFLGAVWVVLYATLSLTS